LLEEQLRIAHYCLDTIRARLHCCRLCCHGSKIKVGSQLNRSIVTIGDGGGRQQCPELCFFLIISRTGEHLQLTDNPITAIISVDITIKSLIFFVKIIFAGAAHASSAAFN
jgi:hypothetical protein